MGSVLVVGSVALDSIKTPHGQVKDVLGGSAVYFALSSRHFADVKLVGVIGNDFPDEYIRLLKSQGVDLAGLEKTPAKTFRWSGLYEGDMSSAKTLSCELNVLADFTPELPESYKKEGFALLANSSPVTQRHVLNQLDDPEFVIVDSMNHWIENERDRVIDIAKKTRVLCLNQDEVRMLSGSASLADGIKKIIGTLVDILVVKMGGEGALLATKDFTFHVPAYSLKKFVDPTGAGDSFAGGFLGYLASSPPQAGSNASLKKALIYGCVMGSFACEGFGTKRLEDVTRGEIEDRYRKIMLNSSNVA